MFENSKMQIFDHETNRQSAKAGAKWGTMVAEQTARSSRPPSPLSCSPGGIWSLSDSVSSAACTTQLLPSFSLSLLSECTRKLHYKQCFIFISNILTILDNKGVSTSII